MQHSVIRACGGAVAMGGVTWGAAKLFSPSTSEVNNQVEIWAGGVFQLGLLALLGVLWGTAATGTGRWTRGVVAAEVVAVVLALGWTVPHLFDANREQAGILPVLDVFWPLSMVGLIGVGVLVVRARRWPVPVRYLPLAASLLVPVDLAVIWAPESARNVVTGLYLAAAYGLLGVLIARDARRLAERAPTAPARASGSLA